MLGGGILVVLGGALLGACFAAAALVILAASLRADRARGIRVAKLALGLAAAGVFLTLPIWRIALTGRDTHGDPCNVWDDLLPSSVLLLEGGALVVAIAGFVSRVRRK
jgi:hypothetical protein